MIKNSSNLFIKKDRNLYVISNSFFSAFINKIERRLISNVIVAKANKILIIRESRYYILLYYNIILICDSEALRNLLLIFIFVFIIRINLY